MLRLAVVGDIHKAWDDTDAAYFNNSDYDLILIVGDLPGRTNRGLERMVQSLRKLTRPALYIPGNHDGVSVLQKFAELKADPEWIRRSSPGQERRVAALESGLTPIPVCGYSRHPVRVRGLALDIIAARPHSMGGPQLSFAPYLERRFGVRSMEDSSARLKALVDSAEAPILFFAHNGPTGLGAQADDIWGCDFRAEGGDFGDADLAEALRHAESVQRPVIGVVAGHMHHALRGGRRKRQWLVRRGVQTFVNAARVPRIYYEAGAQFRHHVRFETDGKVVQVAAMRVDVHGRAEPEPEGRLS